MLRSINVNRRDHSCEPLGSQMWTRQSTTVKLHTLGIVNVYCMYHSLIRNASFRDNKVMFWLPVVNP